MEVGRCLNLYLNLCLLFYPPNTLENGNAKKNNAKARTDKIMIPEVTLSEDFTFLFTIVIKIAATSIENGCSTNVWRLYSFFIKVPESKAALNPGENINNKEIPTKNWIWKSTIVKRVVFFKNFVIFPEFPVSATISAIIKTITRRKTR